MRIEIIGSYPPPLGGIATHIYRLKKYLQGEINFHIYNPGYSKDDDVTAICNSKWWFAKFLFKKNKNIIHFHKTLKGFHFIYWCLYSYINSYKIIITLHNDSILRLNHISQQLVLFILRKTRYLELLVVSDTLYKFLKKSKIRSIYLPAYVPIKGPIDKKNIEKKGSVKYFVYSMFRATKDNIFDVYGFDLAIRILKEYSHELKMLLFIGDKKKSDTKFLEEVIYKHNLRNAVKIMYDSNLIEYLHNGDFFLRSNRKDGYGISIQESLECNIIPIASDVCKRPKGTILFKNDNYLDLSNKVKKVLGMNSEKKRNILVLKENLEFHEELVKIYRKYLKKFD